MSKSPLFLTITLTLIFLISIPSSVSITDADADTSFLFHQDYSPPSPPPPPPHPPPSSCDTDLSGSGSLDTVCEIFTNLTLPSFSTYVTGNGSLFVGPDVHIQCTAPGCLFLLNISGNFTLSPNSKVLTGTFELVAKSLVIEEDASVNVTGRGGEVPEGTSGRPEGTGGGGGGHGGRGAGCMTAKDWEEGRGPGDVWGGDAYSWRTLEEPASYGSRGGSTSREAEYGGGGGGKVRIVITDEVEMEGSILADGGEGGDLGGGGAGGSIYIKAQKM